VELVGQPGHVFAALRERLAKRSSPYEAVFSALAAIAKARLDEAALAALRAEPDVDPEDLEALDAAWEEEEVTFGPGAAAACGTDTLAARLRQAGRPAPGLEAPPRPRTVVTHRHSGHA
jgi:nitrate reductase delta subunit